MSTLRVNFHYNSIDSPADLTLGTISAHNIVEGVIL